MAIQFPILILTLITAVTSQELYQTFPTELEAAMDDMRSKSYYGFVILLKLLNTSTIPCKNGEITFFLPDDTGLTGATIGIDHVHDFILSHTIPSSLEFGNLLQLPNGTLVPTSMPARLLSFRKNGKLGIHMNNARLTRPNICNTAYKIKCHGISAALTF